MENGIGKLLRKLVMKKYPEHLDVYAVPFTGARRYSDKKAYEVFLVIHENDYKDFHLYKERHEEIGNFIRDLGKYMDIEIMGVYHEIVNDEEWEEMQSEKK